MRTQDNQTQQKAWVVFTGQADMAWLKILKPGFHHCFVVLRDAQRWLTLDPLSNHMEARIYDMPGDFNLPLYLRNQGMLVVETHLNHSHQKPAPIMIFTCVETVKRILGLHKRWIITPWQLYRHLTKHYSNHNQKGDLSWEA